MSLTKRIRNLWRLSEVELKKGEISLAQFQNLVDRVKVEEEKPRKMAQIIRRDDPIKKILEHEL